MPRPPDQLVVVDTETTGLDPARDRVIDIGAVRLDADLRVADAWSSLVGPGDALPLQITRLTGISADDLAGAPRSPMPTTPCASSPATPSSSARTSPSTWACWAPARRAAARRRCATRTFDTLHAALLLFPDIDRHGLASMAASLGLGEPPAPRTPRRTRHRRPVPGPASPRGGARRQRTALARGGRMGTPCGARRPGRRRDARRGRPPRRPRPAPAPRPSPPTDARRPWRAQPTAGAPPSPANGALAAGAPGFAERPGQVDLATEIAALLASGGLGLLEAGTGMGKSLAYLLPAAFHAAASGSRVTISTKTKALQRQLAERELPLVASCLPDGFRWTLLMGRENYLCRRRLDEAVAGAGDRLPGPDRLLALAWLCGRARRAEVDVSALPVRRRPWPCRPSPRPPASCAPTPPPAWAGAAASAGSAPGGGPAPRHARPTSSASTTPCCSPAATPCRPSTTSSSTKPTCCPTRPSRPSRERVDRATVDDLLAEARGRHGRRPLAAVARTAAAKAPADVAAGLDRAADGFERAARVLPGLADDLGAALEGLVAAAAPDADADGRPSSTGAPCCSPPACRNSPCSTASRAPAARWPRPSRTWRGPPRRPPRRCPKSTASVPARSPSGSTPPRPRACSTDVTRPPPGDLVLWAEHARRRFGSSGRGGYRARLWSLNQAPLSPAPIVRERLWDKLRSGVLMSATLGVAGSFAYYRGEAGLAADLDVHERVFASPFDYRRQATLVLEHDLGTRYDSGSSRRAWPSGCAASPT